MSAVHVESAILNFACIGCPLWDLDVLSFLPDQALQGCFHLGVINNSSGRLAHEWGQSLCHLLHNNFTLCPREEWAQLKINPTQK